MPSDMNKLAGQKVLLIEDDPDSSEVLERYMSHYGLIVYVAQTAAVALRQLETLVPDIVIIDLRLPDMNGWQLLREMESRQRLPPTAKRIAVTGFDSTKLSQVAVQAGFDGYASKPIEREMFFDLLCGLPDKG